MAKENGVENDDNKKMTDKMDKIMNVCNEVGQLFEDELIPSTEAC